MAAPGSQPRATRVPDIRKGDQVLILTGKDAGKRGTVDRLERPGRVVVEGLNIAKRHTKPRRQQRAGDRMPRVQQGGIMEVARPLDISNVMLVCPSCHQPTRVKHAETATGKSVRACSHCGETLHREARS